MVTGLPDSGCTVAGAPVLVMVAATMFMAGDR